MLEMGLQWIRPWWPTYSRGEILQQDKEYPPKQQRHGKKGYIVKISKENTSLSFSFFLLGNTSLEHIDR